MIEVVHGVLSSFLHSKPGMQHFWHIGVGEVDQPGIILDASGGFDEVYDWHYLFCNSGTSAVESGWSCANF